MPTLYLDYLYHNNTPIHQYVKVFDDRNEFISIKENNGSQKSQTFLVTHEECDRIMYDLHSRFSEKCTRLIPPNYNHQEFNRAIDSRQFLSFLPLGSLGDFLDFEELNCKDYTIGLIITNDYHLNGHLEIHLGYNHRVSDNFNVIEKWTPLDKPSIFKRVENQIDPNVDNFHPQQRNQLTIDIVESAFEAFCKSIAQLKAFVTIANSYTVDINQITPIYLDLKNRNRSRSSLLTNKDRAERILKDIRISNSLIERMPKNHYCYTDFLLWISIERHELYRTYDSFNDVELTSSQAYKDLVKKVNSFSRPDLKDAYEREQTDSYRSIVDLFTI